MDDMEFMDRRQFSEELLKSIRDTDTRLGIIKDILGAGPCPGMPERRKKLVDWAHALLETRLKLVYTFTDLNPTWAKDNKLSCNPFDSIQTDYQAVKRQI